MEQQESTDPPDSDAQLKPVRRVLDHADTYLSSTSDGILALVLLGIGVAAFTGPSLLWAFCAAGILVICRPLRWVLRHFHPLAYWISLSIAATALILIFHVIVSNRSAREEAIQRESDEAERQYRQNVQSRLNELTQSQSNIGARISLLESSQQHRHLTAAQKLAITKAASEFGGQNCIIEGISSNEESINYGADFSEALKAAGWECGLRYGQGFLTNFNVGVFISDQYAYGTPASKALAKELESLGLITDGEHVFTDKDTPVGQIKLRVGIGHPRNTETLPASPTTRILER